MARVTHKTMTVGPDEAKKWLEQNVSNRSLRPSRIKEYATAMSEGRWLYTADPIRFDEDGRLIDGQHRLKAVVKSGCAVEMHIVRGLSRDAQDKVDTGAIRSTADALKVRGFKHGSQIAATVQIVNWLLQGGGFAATYTRDEIVYWTDRHSGLDEIVEQAYRDRNLLPCQLAPYAAAYYAARVRSTEPGATDVYFVDQLVNTIGLTSRSAALAVRRYLLGLREDKRPNNKAAKASTVLALLEGYRYYRADRTLLTMRAPRGGWPVNDPVDIPT